MPAPSTSSFDVVVAGAGLAGLLAAEARSRLFPEERILIADPDFSLRNDRTWCCWTNAEHPLPGLVSASWSRMEVRCNSRSLFSDGSGYRYDMVTERDFRLHMVNLLKSRPGITWMEQPVKAVCLADHHALVTFENETVSAPLVLNSALPSALGALGSNRLLQHFLGWEIETASPVFTPGTVTLMDFDVDQNNGFTFMYVLPFSPTNALVELTLFSPAVLPVIAYEIEIRRWLAQRLCVSGNSYTIIRTEQGVIPMNDDRIVPSFRQSIVDIGAAGGFIKPSSGYSFLRTVQRIRSLEHYWTSAMDATLASTPVFHFFDAILLQVLAGEPGKMPGIFFNLFKKRGFKQVFRFLDEQTGVTENLGIMVSVPPLPFLRAVPAAVRSFLS